MLNYDPVREYTDLLASSMFLSIKEVIHPWRVKKLSSMYKPRSSPRQDEFSFIVLWASDVEEEITWKVDRDELYASGPEEYFEKIVETFRQAWLDRPFPEIEDNITLSEN